MDASITCPRCDKKFDSYNRVWAADGITTLYDTCPHCSAKIKIMLEMYRTVELVGAPSPQEREPFTMDVDDRELNE